MDSYYNNITNYNELYGDEQRHKLACIKELFPNVTTVLDVGCGTMLSREFFTNVTGIDPSEKLLPNDGIVGEAELLPFEDKTFDLVICVTVLQNVTDKEQALNEIKRVSNGHVAISIQKKSQEYEQMKALIEKTFPQIKQFDEGKDMIFYCT